MFIEAMGLFFCKGAAQFVLDPITYTPNPLVNATFVTGGGEIHLWKSNDFGISEKAMGLGAAVTDIMLYGAQFVDQMIQMSLAPWNPGAGYTDMSWAY